MLIYGHDAWVGKWAGDRLGISDWGACRAIGVTRHGEMVAAAVFHQYRHPNIEISFVTTDRHWATKKVVQGILGYPFLQLGCKRLTAITEATNQRTRAFLCRLGFHQEGIHPDAFDSGNAVTYGLLRKDAARWLAEDTDHRQVSPICTADA
jgi:RimJ/RimL family protein N-acetyltransferase